MAAKAKAKAKAKTENKAVAFINWTAPLADGGVLKSRTGFPIFQNSEYPNAQEDMLIDAAKANGGIAKITLVCEIRINTPKEIPSGELLLS